jgi:hypothetical protein
MLAANTTRSSTITSCTRARKLRTCADTLHKVRAIRRSEPRVAV